MKILGTQYYLPPFPLRRYWEQDFDLIARSGLDTIQLWMMWAWVEPAPGDFRFDDYDEIIDLAARRGLGVVLSTAAEMQPQWIHREIPGSEMVDHMGHTVISSICGAINFGLNPGGCFDNPNVWSAMAGFLTRAVEHFRSLPSLRGWDSWNELRWSENADGIVCYCPHTLKSFRSWLDREYGGLDGLNERWHRRYTSWDDVRPGKLPRSPYVEMMEFQRFLTWRSNRHAQARYELMKALDPDHPVTAHGGRPCILQSGGFPNGDDETPPGTALNRGNDWDLVQHLDRIGFSSFPVWQGFDLATFASRVDFLWSAAGEKPVWLSELQGGGVALGFTAGDPVRAAEQQRWIWTAASRAAEAVLFWTCRDEEYGDESASLGLIGDDGFAEERLAAMRTTARLFAKHSDLLDAYRPDDPAVGIWFSPRTYYLHWVQEANAWTPMRAIRGYARALLRNNIPFRIVEEDHPEGLAGLKILFMPRAISMEDPVAETLCSFVLRGGSLVCESECGAFDGLGFYRYAPDRFLASLTGIREAGRRRLGEPWIDVELDGSRLRLDATQWLTPFVPGSGEVLGSCPEGPTVVRAAVDRGSVVLCATYLGDPYLLRSTQKGEAAGTSIDFERFVAALAAEAGVRPSAAVLDPPPGPGRLVHVRTGRSGGRSIAFCLFENVAECRALFPKNYFARHIVNIITDREVPLLDRPEGQECRLNGGEWGVAVLAEG